MGLDGHSLIKIFQVHSRSREKNSNASLEYYTAATIMAQQYAYLDEYRKQLA